ncbi:hypothetical protein A2U01_0051257, partial [Trifolium medium]|nr:hypothetical protein [Trifolium medium]
LGCGDCSLVTVGSNNGVDRKMDKNKSRTDLLAAGKKKYRDVAAIVQWSVEFEQIAIVW